MRLYFEKIAPLHYFYIKFHLMMGHGIYVFDFNCDLKKRKWIRTLINSEKIKRIFVKNLCREQGEAIDQTEIIFDKIKDRKLQNIISRLYGTEQTCTVFKRLLSKEIFKCIYIYNYFIKNGALLAGKTYFVQDNFNIYRKLINKYGTYDLRLAKKIRFYKWAIPILPILHIQEKAIYYFATLFFIGIKISLLAFGKLQSPQKIDPVRFKYMIPLDQYFLIKFDGFRAFDFLLNDKEITKENTLFFVTFNIGYDWLMEQRRKGYNIIEGKDIYGCRELPKANCVYLLRKSTVVTFCQIPLCWNNIAPFLRAFFICIKTFLNWQLILNHVSFNKYIYTNNESEYQLATNIILRNYGAKTYDYSSFMGGPYLRSMGEDSFYDFRHITRSYMNTDYFLAVNEEIVKYYKLHHQTIKNYCILGCIYSEMIKIVEAAISKEELLLQYFNKIKDFKKKKVVSFFDTTFIDSPDSPSTFDDCIGFYQDIMKILESRKDLLVIIKPSKNEEWFIEPRHQWSTRRGHDVIGLWDILKKNISVHWAGDSGDISTIMALSDLVVTHCMSSCTGEALGARKKAIWYEPFNKHKGVMYDKIPGLIIHGYKELEKWVDYYLYRVSNEQYDIYLETNIKGKVEAYCDGLALTRFRNLLADKELINGLSNK